MEPRSVSSSCEALLVAIVSEAVGDVGMGVSCSSGCSKTSSSSFSIGSGAVSSDEREGLAGKATSVGGGNLGSCGSSSVESSDEARSWAWNGFVCWLFLVFEMRSRKDGLDFSCGRGRRPSIYQQLPGDV